MTLNKTIYADGSKGHHRFTLSVNEDSTKDNNSINSFNFSIAPLVSGWNWSGWGGSISYLIWIGDNTYSGTIPAYDGYSTVVLNSASGIEIPHNADGTRTINIGFTVTDGANQRYTCGNASASDTFTLSVLHKAPLITNVAIAETNSQLTGLSVANDLIIQFLSKKRFTITATLYDNATLSNCSVYYNNALIGTANSNQVTVDFSSVSELILANNKVGLQIQVVDSKGGISSQNYNYNVIKYTRPTIENTSSTIKRKTGGGTNLTDNKANLNFVGTCYKANDIIGNNNTQQVQYKVWNNTEPSYTNVPSTSSGNNVTVSNYEISNVLYTSVYNYKIKIYDTFGNYAEKTGSIPTGKSVWSEYKDRVNFDKLTVQNYNPFEYSTEEIFIGIYDGENLYRRIIKYTTSAGYNHISLSAITNLKDIKFIYGTTKQYNSNNKMPLIFYNNSSDMSRAYYEASNNSLIVHCGNDYGFGDAEIIIEYTKL